MWLFVKRRAVAIAVLVFVAFAVALAAVLPRPDVFFSGDGGLKALVVRQHIAMGPHVDLRLSAPAWVQHVWASGLYPFGPPFVYLTAAGARVPTYPPLFALATAPFVSIFGWRGFYVLPALGVVSTLLAVACASSRLGLRSAGAITALVVAGAASPLVLYGAMFWEHAPAVGLAAIALALLVRAGDGRAFAAGVIGGATAALRPEVALFCVVLLVTFAAMPTKEITRRRALFAALGGTLALAVIAAVNVSLYGSIVGLHAKQTAAHEMNALEIGAGHARLLAQTFPAALVAPLVVFLPDRGRLRFARRLAIACVVFFVVACLFLPNSGQRQIGPRFLLAIVPAVALVSGAIVSTRTRALGAVLGVAVLAGVWLDAVSGVRRLHAHYEHHTLPALELARHRPESVVAFTHQWLAQDLEALMPERVFVRLPGLAPPRMDDEEPVEDALAATRTLARELDAAGVRSYLLVALPNQHPPSEVKGGELTTRFVPLEALGEFVFYRAVIVR